MSDAKPTILLATALFLISAPEPDSATIAEMTANFIIPASERALLASDLESHPVIATKPATRAPQSQVEPQREDAGTDHRDESVGPG